MTVKEKIINLLADCGTMTEAEIRDELNISHGTFFAKKEELLAEGKLQQFRLGRATVYQIGLEERAKAKEEMANVKAAQEKEKQAENASRPPERETLPGEKRDERDIVPAGRAAGDGHGGDGGNQDTKAVFAANERRTEEALLLMETGKYSGKGVERGMEYGRITGIYPTIEEWIDEMNQEYAVIGVNTNLDNTQVIITFEDGAQQIYTVNPVAGGIEII